MNTNDIIAEIDAQISRLLEAKALLAGLQSTIKRKPGRPPQVNLFGNATSSIPAKPAAKFAAKRIVSGEARAKMAAAQKARWGKARKAAKRAAWNVGGAPAARGASPNRVVPKTAPAKKAVSAKKATQPKTRIPIGSAA
jgi:hypothetical protein